MTRMRRPGMELPFDRSSAAAYDRISWVPVFNIEQHLFLRKLDRYHPTGTLLDLGCGPGYLTLAIMHRYPELEITGLDVSPDMIKLAEKNLPRGKVKLIVGDAAALPMADSSLDFIVSSASIHHFKDAPAAFHETYRVLKPGGRFLMMDLRRDAPQVVYLLARFISLFAPHELKHTRGVMGSFLTAYTPAEINRMLEPMPFKKAGVSAGLAWLFVSGIK